MPGPASTVGDRPPTNPAFRVRFLPEADDTSFAVAKNGRHRFIELLFSKKAKAPSSGEKEKRSLHSLYEEGNVAFKNWLYGKAWALRGGLTTI